ncbi:MAG TPA: DCC1-like thiol-disulfide oxidoreductase family protein [Gemmatimonadaceae bacterium]
MSDRSALLLYDGTCGFCARSVQFVLRHESATRQTLRFASLQSPTGAEIRARHPELNAIDSVIWYERNASDDLVLVRSTAVLHVLAYLGGVWRILGKISAIVPRTLRDRVYDFVARHRHKLIRGAPSCVIPTAEQRPRFVDFGVTAEESAAPR